TVVALGWFCFWLSLAPRPIPAAAPVSQGTTVYDPDPKHLWNRLHDAFRARSEDGKESDPWELDPFLWRNEQYLASKKGHQSALKVLDEFIASNGHTLSKDPLKRALLQRDLWTLFDSLYVPRWGAALKDPQMKLATRVARITPRLSLTAGQIKKLPNNYAEAVAARKAWFLPIDLWEPKGPWVLLGDAARLPLALNHVHFFGGRSTFFVFLRLPDGREQTQKYLNALRKLAPGATPAPLPSGTQVALVRQLQLIDEKGKPVTTNVTESLRIRPGPFELKLNRRAFLTRTPSLKVVGDDDRERAYLAFMGNNAGEGLTKIRSTCSSCHGGAEGINSVLSYRRFKPLPLLPTVPPELIASKREEEEMRNRAWKGNRYEWGLLQELTQASARDCPAGAFPLEEPATGLLHRPAQQHRHAPAADELVGHAAAQHPQQPAAGVRLDGDQIGVPHLCL